MMSRAGADQQDPDSETNDVRKVEGGICCDYNGKILCDMTPFSR
jgi:hypothetical protein